jgi:hypothetical protein
VSWLVVGIGRRDPQIGCEYELPDEEFDTDTAIEYHLPEEFGFTRAAAWIGRWAPDMAYTSVLLSAERGIEIDAAFGTCPTPGLYRHVLQTTASPG